VEFDAVFEIRIEGIEIDRIVARSLVREQSGPGIRGTVIVSHGVVLTVPVEVDPCNVVLSAGIVRHGAMVAGLELDPVLVH